MPVKSLIIPLEQGKYYHVYNRGNNKERLFHDTVDYSLFLRKYHYYIGPYVQTLAYCLLPNHFHFLIQVNEDATVTSNQFRKLFIHHARRINTKYGRRGCLLTRNFRRVEILDEKYLLNVIKYIHTNPVKHGIIQEFSSYIFSSFNDILLAQNPYVNSRRVIEFYGGYYSFLDFHNIHQPDEEFIASLTEE